MDISTTIHEDFINNNNLILKDDTYLSIPEFYKNKSVFITGATGFLGKILIEKLLRSCPDIKNIYILLRPKKDQKMHERLGEMFRVPLFNKIREAQPDAITKVVAIGGDMKSHALGISENDQKSLIEDVNVVFHVAATVRFNEKIREAVDINVKGTQKLLDLCHRMIGLKAFVYVSTAFSNCDKMIVDEKFYDIPFNLDAVLNLTENFPDEFLDMCESFLLGKRPNTYTLTKAISENVIRNEKSKFSIAVVRPSIVVSTLAEPFAGWIDSFFGPTAILAANSKGIYHTLYCNPNNIVDAVPVDLVINVLIAAGWKAGISKSTNKTIYNVTTSVKNPITWGKFCSVVFDSVKTYPFEGALWYPTRYITSNKYAHKTYAMFVHYVPAYIIDILSRLSGKKPMMVKIQDKLASANEQLEYFKLTEIKFYGDNIDILAKSMTKEDVSNFPIDVKCINWKQCLVDYTLGIRQFVFKQNPATIEECQRRMLKLKILHISLKFLAMFWILKAILFDFNFFDEILKIMSWFIPKM